MDVETSPARGAGRRPASEHAQARAIDGLVQLVLRDGFLHLTVEDMTAHLHCSRATLYSIAPSRQEIVTATIDQFFSDSADAVTRTTRAEVTSSARLEAYLTAIRDQMQRISRRCYNDIRAFGPTDAVYTTYAQLSIETVGRLIQAGVSDGSFRSLHASFVSTAATVLIDGIMRGVFLEASGISDGEAYSELGSLLLAALGVPPLGGD